LIQKANNYDLEDITMEDAICDVEMNANSNFQIVSEDKEETMEVDEGRVEYVVVAENALSETSSGTEWNAGWRRPGSPPASPIVAGADCLAPVAEPSFSLEDDQNLIDYVKEMPENSSSVIVRKMSEISVTNLSFNREKRQRRKENRKKVNEERAAAGLKKIKFKVNKGRKHKDRGQMFKQRRLEASFRDNSP
jgi:hypothetical protein